MDVFVHVLNTEQYRELTGENAPATPVSAEAYTEHGLPWFELYDEEKGSLGASDKLAEVEPLAVEGDAPIRIDPDQVRKIP